MIDAISTSGARGRLDALAAAQENGRTARPIKLALLLGLLAGLAAGCRTPPLESARGDFYAGRIEQAEAHLAEIPPDDKDEVLYLMERGMIRHVMRAYQDSSTDWRLAADRSGELETYSLGRGAASLLTNDRMLAFRGSPFELTLLYAFLAKNYLAERNWDYAAISARNIIKLLENREGFPDTPYGRYMAGFCLALVNDTGNAALQYRTVNELLEREILDPDNGRIIPPGAEDAAPAGRDRGTELVVFIAMGRMPPWGRPDPGDDVQAAPQAAIYAGDRHLGHAVVLDSTAMLMTATRERMAARQLAKDLTRIAVKETIASTVEHQNDTLGQILRLIFFAMEAPDTRCWETLPRWLAVARVPCPEDLESYTVVFSGGGARRAQLDVSQPLIRHGNLFISFCRDL